MAAWSRRKVSAPSRSHLVVAPALSCMVCTALSGAPHLGHVRGYLSVQKQALTQGMAQADLHPWLSGHTSHFSNCLINEIPGIMLEFVGLREE